MTNGLAIGIVVAILGFLALDQWALHWGAALFLARQGVLLLDWLAFWR